VSEITDPFESDSDLAFEAALRPKKLSDFVGQSQVRSQIDLLIKAAAMQGRTPDHVLLAGPPGLGKTTLAMIIAEESGHAIRLTSGPTIQHAGDLASILTSLLPGEVLFIDEIHRMARPAEELLYLAMEDFRVDVMVGKGAGANSISLELAPFTLIGATTRAGMLPNPLRDRFGFTAHLDFYQHEELAEVARRTAEKLGLESDVEALGLISSRSRGTPRIVNRLLRRVRDYAVVHGTGKVDLDSTEAALALYDVDSLGLDRLDRAILQALVNKFAGKAVGLSTLAVVVGEEADTIEAVVEPYLIREGLMIRTPRGRQATPAAFRHLGLTDSSPRLQGLEDL
jgi:Holliday junction DNA helicase RuvB